MSKLWYSASKTKVDSAGERHLRAIKEAKPPEKGKIKQPAKVNRVGATDSTHLTEAAEQGRTTLANGCQSLH